MLHHADWKAVISQHGIISQKAWIHNLCKLCIQILRLWSQW